MDTVKNEKVHRRVGMERELLGRVAQRVFR